jgi:hypothetical protein
VKVKALALLGVVAIGVPAFVLACGKTKSERPSPQDCDALRASAAASASIMGITCYSNAECAGLPAMPSSCPGFVPACKDHRCILRDKREILSAAECEALLAKSNRELEAKLAAADRSCKTDDDCTLTKGGCVGGCGGPAVAKRGEAAYLAEHASVESMCAKWWEGDCMSTTPQAIPSCAPIRAHCKGGLCFSSP